MKTVTFGSTTSRVSAVGLGGEGVLRTFDKLAEAQAVIREAIDQGITYFDSARVYSARYVCQKRYPAHSSVPNARSCYYHVLPSWITT